MTALPFSKTRFKADTSELALQGWDKQPKANADWISALRLRSKNLVEEFGLPQQKLERWKFTNLPARLKKLSVTPAQAAVKIDGNTKFIGNDISANWVREMAEAAPAGEAQYADMMLWHAANAYLSDAVVIDIPKGTQSMDPVSLTITGSEGQHISPRQFIRVADNADFTIIEYHDGQGAFWNNQLTQIQIGKNARLRHYRIQHNSTESVYTQNTHIRIERDGRYESFILTTGAGISRNQIHGDLMGENGDCSLSGLNLLEHKQHTDTLLLTEHRAPHCTSNQMYRTVLKDESRGVFQGKIFVDQIAQKTDGYQLSNNLLLSQLAEMNVKPELEIYADDVKCSHGSTTGQLDETPLFYLRSRGLNEMEARRLLLEAFIGEALEKISDEAVQKDITDRANEWLSRL